MNHLQNKIAAILYQYPLGVSTAIINTIKELNSRGDEVVLFIDAYSYYTAPLKYKHKLFSINIFHDRRSFFLKVFHRLRREMIRFTYERVFKKVPDTLDGYSRLYDSSLKDYVQYVKTSLNSSFTHVIVFELLSVAIAKEAVKDQRLIYYNLELLRYAKSPSDRWRSIKKLEMNGTPRVDHVIIPNINRAKAFSDENGYDLQRIDILPISNRGDCIVERTNYFRKKFGIPPDKLIVIYSTNTVPWAMCHEIIRSVKYWPEDFVLVLHTWSREGMKSQYYKDMLRLAAGLPIYFSEKFVDYDDLPEMLASADIALLFYSPYYRQGEENFEEIVASSNKLAEYLKATLPVIAHGVPRLNDLVESCKIGVFIDSTGKMPDALLMIKKNYGFYRESCKQCYSGRFRFDRNFDAIYNRIFVKIDRQIQL